MTNRCWRREKRATPRRRRRASAGASDARVGVNERDESAPRASATREKTDARAVDGDSVKPDEIRHATDLALAPLPESDAELHGCRGGGGHTFKPALPQLLRATPTSMLRPHATVGAPVDQRQRLAISAHGEFAARRQPLARI